MPPILERALGLVEQGTLPVMIPLILVCFGIGVLVIDRVAYLFDPRFPLSFLPPVRAALRRDREGVQHAFERFIGDESPEQRRALEAACLRYRTPHTRFLLRMTAGSGRPGGTIRELEAERAELEETIAIERGMALLSTLARTAPLLGLMGTVIGMIATFSAMLSNATNDPKALSAGISTALTATFVGLVVSLPGVIGMSSLSRRAHILQSEIRLASMQLRGSSP